MWFFKIILYLSLGFLLNACQIEPLYSPHAHIEDKLQGVAIQAPKNRFEQIITNRLSFKLYGGRAAAKPHYRLAIIGTYYYRYNNLNSKSSLVNGDVYSTVGTAYATLSYELYNLSGKLINKGKLTASAPYTRLAQGYANLLAEQDARRQAALDLADRLAVKLTLWAFDR